MAPSFAVFPKPIIRVLCIEQQRKTLRSGLMVETSVRTGSIIAVARKSIGVGLLGMMMQVGGKQR